MPVEGTVETPVVETPTPGQTATPPAQSASNTQAPRPGSNDSGDEAARHRGILADLQKERTQRQQLNDELTRLRASSEADQRRIRALAGVETPSGEEQEAAQIRAQFEKLFPWAKGLTQERMERILAAADRGDSLEEATQHHWQTHARNQLTALTTELGDVLGSDPTDRQAKAVKRAFTQAAEDDPAFLARFEAGDPTLIKEFVKQFAEDWIEPARRQVTSDAITRARRVPNGRDRTPVGSQANKKIDFKDDKAVGDAFVESFRAYGGQFDS